MIPDDKPVEPIVRRFSASAMGFIRRPELDTATIEVWELPDGRLYAHERERGPLLVEKIDDLGP